ncbi:MAG: hypothetical protein K0M56_04670 [Kaistella sp.]|nr:hypothetical protein [Kaistella sp.]
MIFVFRTSVRTKLQARKLKSSLNKILPNAQWNFDLEDCDKILRIESEDNIVLEITDLLHSQNFVCEELQ